MHSLGTIYMLCLAKTFSTVIPHAMVSPCILHGNSLLPEDTNSSYSNLYRMCSRVDTCRAAPTSVRLNNSEVQYPPWPETMLSEID